MDNRDDICEYVQHEVEEKTIITIDMKRLLKYIKRFARRRQSVVVVRLFAYRLPSVLACAVSFPQHF